MSSEDQENKYMPPGWRDRPPFDLVLDVIAAGLDWASDRISSRMFKRHDRRMKKLLSKQARDERCPHGCENGTVPGFDNGKIVLLPHPCPIHGRST